MQLVQVQPEQLALVPLGQVPIVLMLIQQMQDVKAQSGVEVMVVDPFLDQPLLTLLVVLVGKVRPLTQLPFVRLLRENHLSFLLF